MLEQQQDVECGRCEPAGSLVERLGGPAEVARAIRALRDRPTMFLNRATVYRWTVSKDNGGTDGEIPVKYWSLLIKVGRGKGITVSVGDMSRRAVAAMREAQ